MTHITVNLTKEECEKLHAAGKIVYKAIEQILAEQRDFRTTKFVRRPFFGTRTIIDFDSVEAEKELRDLGLCAFFGWEYDQGKITGIKYSEAKTKLQAMLMMLAVGIEQGSLELVIEPEQGYLFVYTYLIRMRDDADNG